MTLIGGQVAAGTPGAAGGLVVLEHPVERGVGADDEQARAGGDRHQPGAGGRALQLLAARQRDRVAGDDAVDVGAVAADGQGVGVDAVRHLLHRADRLERVAEGLEVGDHGAAAVGLLEVGVGGVDPGVDDRDAHAVAGELLPVGAGERLGGLVAARRDVAAVLEQVDRPGCPRRRSRPAASARPGPGCRCRSPPRRRSGRSWSPRSCPVAATASFACCSVAPCTITEVGVPACSVVSSVARWAERSARSPESAAVAEVGVTRPAEATSAAAPRARLRTRVVLVRTIESLLAPSVGCGATRSVGPRGDVRVNERGPSGSRRGAGCDAWSTSGGAWDCSSWR